MTCLSFAARAFNMPTRQSNLLLRLSFKTARIIDAGVKSTCLGLFSSCNYALHLHQSRYTCVAWTEAYKISWSCLSAIVHTIVLYAFSQAKRRCVLLAQRCNLLQSPLVLMIKARSCRKGARVKGHASPKLHLHLKHASKICGRSAN